MLLGDIRQLVRSWLAFCFIDANCFSSDLLSQRYYIDYYLEIANYNILFLRLLLRKVILFPIAFYLNQ